MQTNLRRFSFLAVMLGALAFVACGGDGEGSDVSTDDASTDGGGTDADASADAGGGGDTDGDCASGFSCRRTNDCAGSGLDFPTCIEGCCVAGDPPELPCAAHLDPCNSDTQTTADFFCDTGAGQCFTKCDYDSADDTQSSDCPLNSYCLSELTAVEPGEFNGACLPGDCDSNIFDPAACDEVGTCRPIGNGASFCVEGGTAMEADPCNLDTSTSQPASAVCAPGLLCFRNECIVPCNRRNGDDDCEEGLECAGAFDTTPRNQPGVCASECGEFSAGECTDGVCRAIFGRFGVNEWLCTEAPEEPLEDGADCSGADAECAEGMICASVTDTEQACMQTCHPLGEGDGIYSACPGGATAGAELIGATAYGEGSEYWSAAEGDYPVEMRDADSGAFVDGLELEVADGTVISAVLAGSADAIETFVLEDLAPGDTLPDQGMRIVHASADLGEVDVWLRERIAEGTGAAESLTWLELTAGDYELVGDVTTFAAGNAYYAVVNASAETEEIAPTLVDDLGEGELGLRYFNATHDTGALDIWVGCTGDDGTFADCDGDTAAVEGLEEDVATGPDFPAQTAADLEGASWYVVAAGSDPADFVDEAVLAAGEYTGLSAGNLYQVTLHDRSGDVAAPVDAVVFPVAEDAFTIALHDLGDEPSLTLDMVSGPVEEAVEYQDTSAGADSAYFAVEPGVYGFALDLGDETWWDTDVVEVAEDDLISIVVAGSAEGDEPTLTAFDLADDFESPEEGEGATRVVHAVVDGPAVTVNEPGAADVVCTPSRVDGFGFCQEACEPYPRREDYGCDDDGTTCLPFVQRDDRPVLPLGFCSEDEGSAEAGEACANDGFLGGDCLDFAVCLDLDDTGAATCLPLCEPFSIDACGDFGTCSGIPPLVGQLNFSFCLPDAQAGQIGDRCTEAGLPCAADNSICLDLGSGMACMAVCREGFDDCAAFDQTCNTGGLNPDVVPTYMGLCR